MAAAVSILTLLSVGCSVPQLAVSESTASSSGATGRLVGVYITKEPLSASLLQEQLGTIMPSDAFTEESLGTVGKLTESTFVENEVTHIIHKYTFPFVETDGMLFGSFTIDTGNGTPYTVLEADDGLSDVHTALNHTDNGESIVQTAVIYQESGSMIYYFNPVYQTDDGVVYVMAGEGIHVSDGLGGNMTQTVKDSLTVTKEGTLETFSSEFTVTVEFAEVPQTVAFYQMNANHELLSRKEYSPQNLPKELPLSADCAYVLMESYGEDGTTRTLWQVGDEAPYVFRSLENGICVKESVELYYENEK